MLCGCGCGGTTPVANRTNSRDHWVKGQPRQFIRGHNLRRSLTVRFWTKVDKNGPNGCWVWIAAKDSNGYGRFMVSDTSGRISPAHRVSYTLVRGPIPIGLEIDHLCRVHACVNPDHLELVSHTANVKRGLAGNKNATKSHCPQGHPYNLFNTIMRIKDGHCSRICRTCKRERWQT